MNDLPIQRLIDNPAWRRVLAIYQDLAGLIPREEETGGGTRWAERIMALDGLGTEELASIHGQLIAEGWLTFQFDEQRGGLTYRVTAEGRQVMSRFENAGEEEIERAQEWAA